MRARNDINWGAMAALTLSAALAACGGGGGDSGPAPTGTPATTVTPPPPAVTIASGCGGCAAVDANTYAGSGTGVWEASNDSQSAIDVPVSIAGLNGQDVSLVFTNDSAVAQAMPAISLTASRFPAALQSLQLDGGTQEADATKRMISDFNRSGWANLVGDKRPQSSSIAPQAPSFSTLTSARTWYHADNSARTATLRKQVSTSDGITVNFWVENGEEGSGRIDATILDSLAAAYAGSGGIYDMLKSVGGAMWGTQPFATLIDGSGQPIDIVILNFDRNNQPYELVGYFYARNNFKRASQPYSNESISLYLDSETLYLAGAAGMQQMRMTMAHEGMHMQNFYRRGVQQSSVYMYDTWLEEATAMMMEDFASFTIDPTYNAIRDVRFRDYVAYGAGSYNCNLTVWRPFDANVCDSYSVSGAFGGFLNRQLGLAFYRNLLSNFSTTNSVGVLDAAIRSVQPGSGFLQQFAAWSATAGSLMPASASPAGYGYPVRAEGGFVLPQIDPASYAARRTLTAAVPQMLQAYASLPIVRQAVRGTYRETVRVPAGTQLSIVVHD
ncbi:M30 family zinc metallopeptidase [Cupriavidus plantarum]|uniref:Peptidase M30-like protein n=1 Tax=Cupriavidus plantarum TaxID=942865 RepID=A0A316ESD0_9BURK|nr:hemagglutinin [Cupriavidus plantarum]PWK35367.1 peptidase M30-like protein [Cupriavidus plantarum]